MDDKNEVKDGGRVLLCFFFFFNTVEGGRFGRGQRVELDRRTDQEFAFNKQIWRHPGSSQSGCLAWQWLQICK